MKRNVLTCRGVVQTTPGYEKVRDVIGTMSIPGLILALIFQPWFERIGGMVRDSVMNVNWDKWLERWMG